MLLDLVAVGTFSTTSYHTMLYNLFLIQANNYSCVSFITGIVGPCIHEIPFFKKSNVPGDPSKKRALWVVVERREFLAQIDDYLVKINLDSKTTEFSIIFYTDILGQNEFQNHSIPTYSPHFFETFLLIFFCICSIHPMPF